MEEEQENKKKFELDFSYFEKKETLEFSKTLKNHKEKATIALKEFVIKIGTEAKETHSASKVVMKFVKEGKVSKEEELELRTQVYDLFKMAGIGIPFMMIPGSSLLLPYLLKIAEKKGIDLLPSAFKKEDGNLEGNDTSKIQQKTPE